MNCVVTQTTLVILLGCSTVGGKVLFVTMIRLCLHPLSERDTEHSWVPAVLPAWDVTQSAPHRCVKRLVLHAWSRRGRLALQV